MQQLCKSCYTGSTNENYLEVDDDESCEPAQDQFYETSAKKRQNLM